MSFQVEIVNHYPFGGRANQMVRYREWWGELREWLLESQFPHVVTEKQSQNEIGRWRKDSTTFVFEDRNHAMLFKLLWGSYDRG